jgi:hypothetical protein
MHYYDQSTTPILINFTPMEDTSGAAFYNGTLLVYSSQFTERRRIVILYSLTRYPGPEIPLHHAMNNLSICEPPKPASEVLIANKLAVVHDDLRLSHTAHAPQ